MADTRSSLVTVGIPTFNRPQGLRHTLECLTRQTHTHLEIIISDNASPGTETQAVAEQFAEQDARISYHRQISDLGALRNFRSLLQRGSADYFMWAADDDDWDPRFISTCLGAIGEFGSSCCLIGAYYSGDDRREVLPTPLLGCGASVFDDAAEFLRTLRSSLFYGIHRRSTIMQVLKDGVFDYYDCYVILRQILTHRMVVVPEVLYWAGIKGNAYEPKPAQARKGRVFDYVPFVRCCVALIARSSSLTPSEKTRLIGVLMQTVAHEFGYWETGERPFQAKVARGVERIARRMNHR